MSADTTTERPQRPRGGGGGGRRPFFRRRKTCPFSGANAPKIDYKDTKLLSRYISERGKIVPSKNYGGFGQETARTRACDQAGSFPGAAALRFPVMTNANAPAGERRCGVNMNRDLLGGIGAGAVSALLWASITLGGGGILLS